LPKAKKKLNVLAASLLPASRYGDYAQALMDLGATICTPRNPKCDLCPWQQVCQARIKNIQDKLPRKLKAKPRPVRHAIAFVAMNNRGQILLRKRPAGGLLSGMMEVPSSEWVEGMKDLADVLQQAPITAAWILLPGTVTHVFSHFELQVKVAFATTKTASRNLWFDIRALDKQALPSIMHKIVQHAINRL